MRTAIIALSMLAVSGAAAPGQVVAPGSDAARLGELRKIDARLAALCGGFNFKQLAGPFLRDIDALSQRRSEILRGLHPRLRTQVKPTPVDAACRSHIATVRLMLATASATAKPTLETAKQAQSQRRSGWSGSGPPTTSQPTAQPKPSIRPSGPTPTGGGKPPLQDLFPWPPPTASTWRVFSPHVSADAGPAKTAGDVARRLETLLQRVGLDGWGYYRVPGGFALVTGIDRLDPQTGRPFADERRRSRQVSYVGFSFSRIISIAPERGYYRVLVFALTDAEITLQQTDPAEAFAIAERWAREGILDLPSDVAKRPINPEHRLALLVYEFEADDSGKSQIFRPSRWPFDLHAESLGPPLLERP